jgi:hypothetical protein
LEGKEYAERGHSSNAVIPTIFQTSLLGNIIASKYLIQWRCALKVLESGNRGNVRGASGCTRAEEAVEAVVVEEVEAVVETVVAVVETTGVEAMVVMTEAEMMEGAMTGVGMMMVRAGKTEEYDKEREQDPENRKGKERKRNGGIDKGKRTNTQHPQGLMRRSPPPPAAPRRRLRPCGAPSGVLTLRGKYKSGNGGEDPYPNLTQINPAQPKPTQSNPT